ncbi:hypothetical protein [Deferribacter desulfuricans]|uniref:hypothetical protein n=1 Tax=Deferribacter desulfuricans TaxID=197162 RepID=UPI00129B75C1|nr:hypothetical protein [Deferribacter desulfuricans]
MYKNLSRKSVVLINTSPYLILAIKIPITKPAERGERLNVIVNPVNNIKRIILRVYKTLLSLKCIVFEIIIITKALIKKNIIKFIVFRNEFTKIVYAVYENNGYRDNNIRLL